MVILSSFYVYVCRVFLIFAIGINSLGIFFIKFFISKEKADTYDLSPNLIFIIVCLTILIISLSWDNVIYDKTNNVLNVKSFKKKIIVHSNDIIKVERTFILLCRITYNDKTIKKSILFLPSIREFFPLLDFPQRIRELIGKK